jgi:hypothetical protein
MLCKTGLVLFQVETVLKAETGAAHSSSSAAACIALD